MCVVLCCATQAQCTFGEILQAYLFQKQGCCHFSYDDKEGWTLTPTLLAQRGIYTMLGVPSNDQNVEQPVNCTRQTHVDVFTKE